VSAEPAYATLRAATGDGVDAVLRRCAEQADTRRWLLAFDYHPAVGECFGLARGLCSLQVTRAALLAPNASAQGFDLKVGECQVRQFTQEAAAADWLRADS
jgi:hypothetical protein